MRKLHFPIRTARAIADPDEPTMSEQSMNERGVIIFGGYACDLNLEVTLDKREHDDIHLRGAFSLFFALRLSQIDIMRIMSFLDYQLDKTFKGEFRLSKIGKSSVKK